MDITIYVLCAIFGEIAGYRIREAKDMEDE